MLAFKGTIILISIQIVDFKFKVQGSFSNLLRLSAKTPRMTSKNAVERFSNSEGFRFTFQNELSTPLRLSLGAFCNRKLFATKTIDSIYPSVHLLSIYLSIYLSMTACLPTSQSVSQSISLSVIRIQTDKQTDIG